MLSCINTDDPGRLEILEIMIANSYVQALPYRYIYGFPAESCSTRVKPSSRLFIKQKHCMEIDISNYHRLLSNFHTVDEKSGEFIKKRFPVLTEAGMFLGRRLHNSCTT